MNNEQLFKLVSEGKLDKIVAVADGKQGCPEPRIGDKKHRRCGLGVYTCAVHGRYSVELKD